MSRQRKALRWTMSEAASEFDLHAATLAKRIKTAGIEPSKDGKWSTVQICAAVFGDMDSEKLRETRHKANLLEIEEKEKRRMVVSIDDVGRTWDAVVIALRQAIWNFDAPEETRRQWLGELRDLKPDDYFAKADASADDEAAA